MRRGGAILIPTNSFFLLGVLMSVPISANFGENRSRNATLRVIADGHAHTNRRKPILHRVSKKHPLILLAIS